MKKILMLVAVLALAIGFCGCGESKKDSKSQLTAQKEQIIREMDTLLADFPDSQKRCLIYGNSTNSDDKANAMQNLMDKGILSKFTDLAEKLNKVEDELK